jgi:hypothetical protein
VGQYRNLGFGCQSAFLGFGERPARSEWGIERGDRASR